MGDAEGHVDSDYSGRPLGRPTREEIAAAAAADPTPRSFIGGHLPDGSHVLIGPDGKWYYEHFEGNRPMWDRPVPAELLEECNMAFPPVNSGGLTGGGGL